MARQRKEGESVEERPEIPSDLFGGETPATATLEPPAVPPPPAVEPGRLNPHHKATIPPRPAKIPRVGQSVIYGGFSLTPYPCHAKVAAIRLDGTLNLGTLGSGGDWGTATAIAYSPTLRSGFWSWPDDVLPPN